MGHKEKAVDNWKDEVKSLINLALSRLKCKPEGLENKIKEKFPSLQEIKSSGLGSRNLYKYLNGETKTPPKKELIEYLAETCGEDTAYWTSKIFAEEETKFIAEEKTAFLSASEIISLQRSLDEGDLVTIVSSKQFLEASNQEIAQVVLENLDRGIQYQYIFPKPDSKPFGDIAYRTFVQFFNDKVTQRSFKGFPQIAGIAIDAKNFQFFSSLHSLVCILKSGPSRFKAFSYIEISKHGNSVEGCWYRIPDPVWQQVLSEVSIAQSPLKNKDMKVVPLDSRLHTIRTVYVNWFKDERCARHYHNLRPTLGHAGEDCVRQVISSLGRQNFGEMIRYLDIGCGDGELTSEIAKHLSSRAKVILTALDASEHQLSMAQQNILKCCSSTNLLHRSFEEYHKELFVPIAENPQSTGLGGDAVFDVITAIHSMYVLDAAYVRSIYELLASGGVAMIWMASGNANVIAGLTSLLDSQLRPGQKRNTAEQCLSYAKLAGLNPDASPFKRKIRDLISNGSLTEQGHALIKYCSLQDDLDESVLSQASKFLLENVQGNEEHLLTDYLLIFKRN